MRVVRVVYQGRTFYASLQGDNVFCLNKNLGLDAAIPLREVAVVPPVMPTKIVCAQVNSQVHARETGSPTPVEPRLFLKPPSTVIGTGQAIVLPWQSRQVEHQAQLAMVLGKACHKVPPESVAEYIFGYACANDVTARDLEKLDACPTRAKGFDTFCPVGPWIETAVEDVANLTIRTQVNGTVVQEGSTADMLFKPFDLVSYISAVMTLNPGDVVLTGTPGGVGAMHAGDEVRIEIDNVGILINPVMAEETEERSVQALQ